MTSAGRDFWLPLTAGAFTVIACIGMGVGAVWLIDGGDMSKPRAECDRQVSILFASTDLVEVTRAGIIIERLNCSVRRRLQ
jgi:hypothetical protein